MTAEAIDQVALLWRDFKSAEPHRTLELRNQLVVQYSPLVKYVAGRVRSTLPHNIESADLVSEGVIGLMDAIEKFDPDRGWEFQTYAVQRIRGAIIDSIRAADWVPRSVRTRVKAVERAREELRHRLARTPTDEELCAEADITAAELRELREKPQSYSYADQDELAALDDFGPEIDDALEHDDTRATLMAAVRRMPERDQIIIALYFFEGLTLGEIGQVLGVTESRVSQLRSRATATLREQLTASLHH